MTGHDDHAVGLRELRHSTRDVLDRVERGETIDVTDYGRLVARLVPVHAPSPAPTLDQLVADGRATRAQRPGFRPVLHPGDGTDRLAEALEDSRNGERG